ncbi:hypothetical protein Tco_0370839 [Tanacetum coccineum]
MAIHVGVWGYEMVRGLDALWRSNEGDRDSLWGNKDLAENIDRDKQCFEIVWGKFCCALNYSKLVKVSRLLVIPTPPPSPLSLWSLPLPQIPSPPLPLRAEAASTSHSLPLPPPIILSHTRSDASSSGTSPLLPISLPTSLPPLHLLSTDRRVERLEVTLLPQKRLGIYLGLRYKVRESSSAPTARPPRGFRADYGFVATIDREIIRDLERDVGYGITDTWDEMLVDMPGAPATDDTELGRQMTEFTTRVRQDTDKIYTRLDDEQYER